MSEQMPMTGSLAGRVALITGGAVRVGRVIALALAGRGAQTAFTYLPGEPHEQTVAEICELGGEALALPLDVREPGAPERVDRKSVV